MPSQTSTGNWGGGSPGGDPAGSVNIGATQSQPALDALCINVPPTSLVNGTPVLGQYLTPNDGVTHTYQVSFAGTVTSAETGGACNVTFTSQGVGQTLLTLGGGTGPGPVSTVVAFQADPGTVIKLNQSSALTVGAAKVSATLELIV